MTHYYCRLCDEDRATIMSMRVHHRFTLSHVNIDVQPASFHENCHATQVGTVIAYDASLAGYRARLTRR